jgi:hypothetical protein
VPLRAHREAAPRAAGRGPRRAGAPARLGG